MSRPVRLLVLQLMLIVLISFVSGYEVPDFSQLNLQIVLFLTPFGMVSNFTDAQSMLRPYYFEIAPGHTQFTPLKVALLSALYLIAFFNFALIIKGLRRR